MMQAVMNASPEYYLVRYDGVNNLIARITELLDRETWTSGNPPVLHRLPCLEVLDMASHAASWRCGGLCHDNVVDFASAIEGLRYCDDLSIYLSGCNTGCRDGGHQCIAELVAQQIPSAVRVRQYRCTVYGTRGYQNGKGSYAGKNSEVTETYVGPGTLPNGTKVDDMFHAAHEHSADAERDPSSVRDESYQGFRGPNSA